MFSAIRTRLTPATVIATVALIFAMTGGAYAAKKFLITSTKQISPSVLKALKGKAGPAGPAGSAGAAGTAGPQGPAGTAGTPGAKGETGAPGEKGVQGEKGEKGAKGTTGEPWTPNNTLPVGASETGTWSIGPAPEVGHSTNNVTTISFPIRLAAALENAEECGEAGQPACVVHIFEGTTAPSGCSLEGTLLKADSGNLCIKDDGSLALGAALKATEIAAFNVEAVGPGAGVTGVILSAGGIAEGTTGIGTWAVTG